MKYKNEHQRHMAILEAALPYVTPGSRHGIQLLLQADSFIQLARQEPDLVAQNYNPESTEAENGESAIRPDLQGLLLHIQEFLTPRESDIVQTVLNFMNANKLLQNYNTFMHSHSISHENDEEEPQLHTASFSNSTNPMQMLFQLINGLGAIGNGFNNSSQQNRTSGQNNMMTEFLMSQLNPEQKATFEQLQNIMYNESV